MTLYFILLNNELSPFDQNFSVKQIWWNSLFKISGAYPVKIQNKAYEEHVHIDSCHLK